MCKISKRHAFLLGGKVAGALQKSCLRYDLDENVWLPMPDMQVARAASSSCYIAGYVYVLCGGHKDSKWPNSIEKLFISESTSEQLQQSWHFIPMKNVASELTPRTNFIACPINKTEIVIMGGQKVYEVIQVLCFC